MRIVMIENNSFKIKGFKSQLTKWQEHLADLRPFIKPFIKYKEEKKGVIVNSPRGYAIFTSGKG